MPALLERLVSQLEKKNYKKPQAYAIATAQLQKAGDLKPGTTQLTKQGSQRQNMGAGGRAKARAARYSGRKPADFTYSSKTNRARVRGR